VSRTILLELRCQRRGHLIARVVHSGDRDTAMIEAPRYSAGRTKATWTPACFPLVRGSGHRYGCACGMSDLILDGKLAEAISSGVRTWIVCYLPSSPSDSAN
jgi:hypothetical protein